MNAQYVHVHMVIRIDACTTLCEIEWVKERETKSNGRCCEVHIDEMFVELNVCMISVSFHTRYLVSKGHHNISIALADLQHARELKLRYTGRLEIPPLRYAGIRCSSEIFPVLPYVARFLPLATASSMLKRLEPEKGK
jgi:hypothetical protein